MVCQSNHSTKQEYFNGVKIIFLLQKKEKQRFTLGEANWS